MYYWRWWVCVWSVSHAEARCTEDISLSCRGSSLIRLTAEYFSNPAEMLQEKASAVTDECMSRVQTGVETDLLPHQPTTGPVPSFRTFPAPMSLTRYTHGDLMSQNTHRCFLWTELLRNYSLDSSSMEGLLIGILKLQINQVLFVCWWFLSVKWTSPKMNYFSQ